MFNVKVQQSTEHLHFFFQFFYILAAHEQMYALRIGVPRTIRARGESFTSLHPGPSAERPGDPPAPSLPSKKLQRFRRAHLLVDGLMAQHVWRRADSGFRDATASAKPAIAFLVFSPEDPVPAGILLLSLLIYRRFKILMINFFTVSISSGLLDATNKVMAARASLLMMG